MQELQSCRDEFVDVTFSADLMKHDVEWDGPPLAARIAAALVDDDLPCAAQDILATSDGGHIPQAKMMRVLIQERYSDSIAVVFTRRAALLLEKLHHSGRFPLGALGSAVEHTPCRLRCRSPIFIWLPIRTWTNSWPTAQRTQKGAVGCIFACAPPALDALPHVAFCPVACAALARTRGEHVRDDLHSCLGLGTATPGWTESNLMFASQLALMYLKAHKAPSTSAVEGRRIAGAMAAGAVRHLGRLR